MHIGYYSPAWPPAGAANGVVTYVSVIRDYLLAHGHDVSVISRDRLYTSDGGEHDLAPDASLGRFWTSLASRVDRRLGHHPFTARRLAGQFRHSGRIVPIDLVEMEESFGWSGTAQQRLSIPVVTRLHGPHFLKPEQPEDATEIRHSRHRKRAEGRAIAAAAALSAPTRMILDATCDRYRRSRRQAEVIPNPIVVSDETDRWRADRCDPDLILFVGRLDHLKGADTIIDAFARVLARRPTARLAMVGPDGMMAGAGTTIPATDYLRDRVAPTVLDRIAFKGVLARPEIAALRREACMTVVASRCENFPYAAVEAMAAGSPLICTDWLGSADVVSHCRTGWLTPIGDVGRMADWIEWLFDNPGAAALAGRAARERCGAMYSLEEVGARMVAFYDRVLSLHAARR